MSNTASPITPSTQKLNADWQGLAEAIVRGFCEFAHLPYTAPANSPPPTSTPGTNPAPTHPALPAWKQEAVNWLYAEGLITNDDWRTRLDEPLPLWAEAVILRRMYEKLRG